jgi:hypothetical protein
LRSVSDIFSYSERVDEDLSNTDLVMFSTFCLGLYCDDIDELVLVLAPEKEDRGRSYIALFVMGLSADSSAGARRPRPSLISLSKITRLSLSTIYNLS